MYAFYMQIPRMSAYIRFCSCQISAAMYLQYLTETLPEFVQVAHTCQQDPRTKGMPLSSFLIKPMQRITKYPLIISKVQYFFCLQIYVCIYNAEYVIDLRAYVY